MCITDAAVESDGVRPANVSEPIRSADVLGLPESITANEKRPNTGESILAWPPPKHSVSSRKLESEARRAELVKEKNSLHAKIAQLIHDTNLEKGTQQDIEQQLASVSSNFHLLSEQKAAIESARTDLAEEIKTKRWTALVDRRLEFQRSRSSKLQSRVDTIVTHLHTKHIMMKEQLEAVAAKTRSLILEQTLLTSELPALFQECSLLANDMEVKRKAVEESQKKESSLRDLIGNREQIRLQREQEIKDFESRVLNEACEKHFGSSEAHLKLASLDLSHRGLSKVG